ncbi:MAG: SurA N-terminal domain-containing protein [Candidatus Cybelea sp.]
MRNAPRVIIGLITLLSSTPLAACSSSSGDAAVTVNGQPISQSTLLEHIERKPESGKVLGHLIEEALINQYAEKNHIVVTDAEVAAREEQLKAKFPGSAWSELLEKRNLSESTLPMFVRTELLLEKIVASDVRVTPADVKDYYGKHRASYDKPGRKATLASVTPQITALLRDQQTAEYSLGVMQDLTTQAKIVIKDPRYADIFKTPAIPPGNTPVAPQTQ